MRRSSCRSRELAALAAALAFAAPRWAEAQACCAGASALTPARLALHEDALVGLQVKASDLHGSFDGGRRYVASPAGAAELDLEEDLYLTVRALRRGQISIGVPIVQTWRRVPGLSELGGGFGDFQLGLRWDFVNAGDHAVIPGIALTAGATVPSGRAPEEASKLLATDATGIGAVQGSLGLALEQTFGRALVNVTGTMTWRSPRVVGSVHTQQGIQLGGFAAAGYSFKNGAVLALTAAYTAELDAVIDGALISGSGKALTRFGVAGGYLVNDAWRIQGSVFGDAPVFGFGKNQPAGVGFTFMLVRTWS